jgi:hypothetical protein
MLPLEKILGYWEIEEDSSGLEEWDDCTDVPESLDVHLLFRKDPQYQMTISVSTKDWKFRDVMLWFQKEGEIGMRPLRSMGSGVTDLNQQLEDWIIHPERYNLHP